jgi:glycosyltransferase involved in cell wall biosynthesis
MHDPLSIDVVIPARNEQATIGPIVRKFRSRGRIGSIYVVVDRATTDWTKNQALEAGANVIMGSHENDKGQNVAEALDVVRTDQVIFCDGDYLNLSRWHIARISRTTGIQIIGAPDIPKNYPASKLWAWPWVSGFRSVPTNLVRGLDLRGYLMEVQINDACWKTGIPTQICSMVGLVSPYSMTDKRKRERDRDFKWAEQNGVLTRDRARDTGHLI